MDYLTRPIFEFEPDWSDVPTRQFLFDLRELQIGFGAEYFNTLQQHVATGYKFQLTLSTAAEVQALDDFIEDLTGPLQGFWLPTPFESVQIVTADDATHFYIADQNLRATFEDHPDIYLLFTRAGAVRAAKIAAVNAASNGRERITLTGALATPATPEDVACRLHYVRLAGDQEEGRFLTEGVQQRTVSVVELPHEYEAFETGEEPVWLYHFACAAPMDTHWRYTSFAAAIVSDNELFTPFPMEHRSLKKSVQLDTESLDIEAKHDAAHPFALFLPIPLGKLVTVEVFQVTLGDPETREMVFTGRVRRVDDAGDRLVAHCDSWTAVLNRKVLPMMFQAGCNYDVFNPHTCKLQRWMFETTGTVVSVDNTALPPFVVLDLDIPDSLQFENWMSENWFADGFVEAGSGTGYQIREILTSRDFVGQLRLQLNAPLDAEVGAKLHLIPGCNGTAARCRAFNNFPNFGGFPAIPEKNLSLQAMDAIVSQGGKK
jgi:uncharacterized phage protein (TIGR02218 family)